jgi:hypothetical protein
VSDFEFTLGPDESITLHSAIFQALGAASMCWERPPEGVFDSTRAKEIGDYLHGFLDELLLDAEHALWWCGGASDFGPGGQAEEGWKKVVQPVLHVLREVRARVGDSA